MKVGIVGLGIAGIRAAMLLESQGITVELFEAKGRPGGRLQTSDEGGGVLYEAGGEWIDADHGRVIGLLNEFGLEPESRPQWPRKLIYRGKETTEDLLWTDALEDDLRVETAARELCQRLADLSEPKRAELDAQPLADFVREHTNSDRGLWYVTHRLRSDEGEDLDRISLLGWLEGYRHYLERDGDEMSAFRFPGGAQTLCNRMLERVRGHRQYEAVLRRVRQDHGGVTLIFDGGESRVDYVILTLPPPALERVVFEPALSVPKRCAVEACQMSRAIKICWHFERPWWTDAGWGGSLACDGPIMQTWDGSLGDAAVLNAYICGEKAVEWMALGDPVRAGLYELSLMFPDATKYFTQGWAHNWISDEFAMGAFSNMGRGYASQHLPDIAPPEGRVFFAGEHTAQWSGFIEGALESAERVRDEVIRL